MIVKKEKESHKDSQNILKDLKYDGPMNAKGNPDKRSKEWKKYIKRKKELESKIEVEKYLNNEYKDNNLVKNLEINNIIQTNTKKIEVEKLDSEDNKEATIETEMETEKMSSEDNNEATITETENLDSEDNKEETITETENLDSENINEETITETENLDLENNNEETITGTDNLDLENSNEETITEEESVDSGIDNKDLSANFENNDVRGKILKLFTKTSKKEFINLIDTLDDKNFNLLQNELSQIFKESEKSLQLQEKKINSLLSEISDLELDNKDLRSEFIKYCPPKILTVRFNSLKLWDNKIELNVSNRWQIMDKNNSKCIKIKCNNLVNEWEIMFKSRPYITIMQEKQDGSQRVFILNQADIDNGDNDITIKYEKGMVQHSQNKALVDINDNYEINKGIICIHT
jgi:hypothetical protein